MPAQPLHHGLYHGLPPKQNRRFDVQWRPQIGGLDDALASDHTCSDRMQRSRSGLLEGLTRVVRVIAIIVLCWRSDSSTAKLRKAPCWPGAWVVEGGL